MTKDASGVRHIGLLMLLLFIFMLKLMFFEVDMAF